MFGRHTLENEQNMLIISRKINSIYVSNDKILELTERSELWKNFTCHCELNYFSVLSDFSGDIGGDISEVIL